MAKFSNLAFLHGSTFNHLQQKYVFPVVEEEAAEMFEANKEKHRGKQLVVLGVYDILYLIQIHFDKV